MAAVEVPAVPHVGHVGAQLARGPRALHRLPCRRRVVPDEPWESCALSEVNLRDADFHGSKLAAVHFLGCDLTGADFSRTTTSALALHGSTLDDLKGAANLRGAIAGDQVLPLALRVFASMGIAIDDDYLA